MKRQNAKRLVVYLNALDSHRHGTLYEAVVHLLRAQHCSGASVIKGVAGYGQSNEIHKQRLLSITANVPVKIEAIDTEAKINMVLPLIEEMVGNRGLIEVHDTEMIKFGNRAETSPS